LKRDVEARLREELRRLKEESGRGYGLSVRWVPNPDSDRHGEVKGDIIYIYDTLEDRALETLEHEFVDQAITEEVIDPLIKYINIQKCLIEDLIYSRKERLVKSLLKLLKEGRKRQNKSL
ncbi:MAG: hypothetical protein ACTSXC_05600, partial [Candidatus Freyarchaeota archaeon]